MGKQVTLSRAEYETAIKAWLTSRIEDGPQYIIELAKFCFGASAATCAALATLSKAYEGSVNLNVMWGAIGVLALSMAIAFDMIRPRTYELNNVVADIEAEYKKQAGSARWHISLWLICWVGGTGAGLFALLHK